MSARQRETREFIRNIGALLIGSLAAFVAYQAWQVHAWPLVVLLGCVVTACVAVLMPAVLQDLLAPFVLVWVVVSVPIRLFPAGRRWLSELDLRKQGRRAGRGELDAEAGGVGPGAVGVRVRGGEEAEVAE